MRFWVYLAAMSVSLAMWVASWQAAAAGYRLVEAAGLLPGLHIDTTLLSLFG